MLPNLLKHTRKHSALALRSYSAFGIVCKSTKILIIYTAIISCSGKLLSFIDIFKEMSQLWQNCGFSPHLLFGFSLLPWKCD